MDALKTQVNKKGLYLVAYCYRRFLRRQLNIIMYGILRNRMTSIHISKDAIHISKDATENVSRVMGLSISNVYWSGS
jgi:hypothetical protein